MIYSTPHASIFLLHLRTIRCSAVRACTVTVRYSGCYFLFVAITQPPKVTLHLPRRILSSCVHTRARSIAAPLAFSLHRSLSHKQLLACSVTWLDSHMPPCRPLCPRAVERHSRPSHHQLSLLGYTPCAHKFPPHIRDRHESLLSYVPPLCSKYK